MLPDIGPFRSGPAPGTVLPEYEGLGLANVVPTVERLLGVESPIAPLSPQALPPTLLDGVERVAVLVVDALGYDQLADATARGLAPRLAALAERPGAHLGVLTSTFPSTTVVALTTLGSGLPPSRHGVVSHVLYDAALGTTVDLLRFAPALAGRSLDREGIDAAHWAGFPSVYERLAERGVPSVVVNHRQFEGTALSRINHRGANYSGFYTVSDLCVNLRAAIEAAEARGGPAYIHAYWGTLDSVTHGYGPDSPQHDAEICVLDYALGELLLGDLSAPGTLLLLTADHGHVTTSPERTVRLNGHPELLALLQSPPAGLDRAGILYVRPGCEAQARAYVERHMGEHVDVLSAQEGVALGLYGPEPLTPRAEARIGQLLLLPRGDWLAKYRYPTTEKPKPGATIGKHGGLSRGEMLVPLLALRLG